jgi:hypothetical protein
MATLSKQGNEIFRFFSIRKRGLISIRDNGVILRRTPWSNGWKIIAKKKPEVSIDAFLQSARDRYEKLAEWKKQIKSIPTYETLEEWEREGICETPTGYSVEPDGVGPDGVPSWLRCFSII